MIYSLKTRSESFIPRFPVPLMNDSKLSPLPLLTPAVPQNVLGQISDAAIKVREALRSYLEIEIDDANKVVDAGSVDAYTIEARRAIDEAENEILAIDAQIKQKRSEGKQIEVDLKKETAREFNLIRHKYLKLNWRDTPWDETFKRKTSMKLKKRQTFKKSSSRLFDDYKSVPYVLKHSVGFSEEDLDRNKWYTSKFDDAIRIEPQEIIFSKYDSKKKYTRTITLTNVSEKLVNFQVSLLGVKNGIFEIQVASPIVGRLTLAPGIRKKIKVAFQPKDLDDYFCEFVVAVDRGPRNSIVVRAKRNSPTLISKTDLNPTVKKVPSDSITVDCGIRLLGSKFVTQTVASNVGSDAKYFIMSEMSWELSHIKGVQIENNRLEVSPFSIRPYYFSLKNGREIQIQIEYEPDCEGTHTDQLMIACDNVTMRTLDLLGEAVLFDPRDICIEANCKDFDVDEPDVYDAFSCLDFGIVRIDGVSERYCKVSSKNPADLQYRWELSSADLLGISEMKAVSLTLSPKRGVICDSSPVFLRLECDMLRFPPGIYKGLLSFVIEKLPRISLANSDAVTLKFEELKDGLVDITVQQIEVKIEVRELQITLEPSYIVFQKRVNESEKRNIVAINESPYAVELRWTAPASETVRHVISPETAVIDALSRMNFEYELTTAKEGRVSDIIRLDSCLENRCFHILVEGRVENPTSLKTMFLAHNIGPQRIDDAFGFTIPLLVENQGEQESAVTGGEYQNSELIRHFTDDIPTLQRNQDKYVTAVLYAGSGSIDGVRLTTAAWTSGHANVFSDTYCIIERPNVTLSASTHEITPDGGFYQNALSNFSVSLINQNHLRVQFIWLNASGAGAAYVTLTADPIKGALEPFERRRVNIGVKAHRPGVIRDLRVHCCIENTEEPLVLSITGFAKTITVEVSYKSMNEEVSFTLPSAAEKLMVSEDLDIKDERCCVCFIGKFEDLPVPPKSLLAGFQEEKEQQIKRSHSTVSVTPYKNWPLIGGYYSAEPIKLASLNKLYQNFLTKEDHTDWRTSKKLTETLIKAFGQRAFFFNIETFKESSQVIKINNLTLVRTSYTAEIHEFHEKKDADISMRDHESLIQSKAGLLLSVAQKTGCLRAESCSEITVTAYGNCWGIYFDHITVNIPDLDRIVIPIVVIVTGRPVWFTFAPPEIYQLPEPILRFSATPPNYKTSQTVYVYNNSFLRLKLAWMTYSSRQQSDVDGSHVLTDKSPCLSVCPEFHPTDNENFLKIHMVNYLGEIDSIYYNVEPRVCYITPKGKCSLTITMNTRNLWFDLSHLVHQLVGSARAFIYTEDNENMSIDDKYSVYRPVGPDIEPLILKLETRVQLSKLRVINCAKDDFILSVTASRVFLNPSKIYQERRRYHLMNRSEGPALVKFFTRGIVNFVNAFILDRVPGTSLSDKNEITVNSGDTIELTVSLILKEQDIYSRVGNFGKSDCAGDDDMKDLIIINQGHLLEQEIPIAVNIIPPHITLSTEEINFGSSLLYHSKTQSFRLRTEQGPEVFTIKLITDFSDIFEITPQRGMLASMTFINVDVRFTPKECLAYSAKLLAVPCLPMYAQEINLFGCGTWDSEITF